MGILQWFAAARNSAAFSFRSQSFRRWVFGAYTRASALSNVEVYHPLEVGVRDFGHISLQRFKEEREGRHRTCESGGAGGGTQAAAENLVEKEALRAHCNELVALRRVDGAHF